MGGGRDPYVRETSVDEHRSEPPAYGEPRPLAENGPLYAYRHGGVGVVRRKGAPVGVDDDDGSARSGHPLELRQGSLRAVHPLQRALRTAAVESVVIERK